MVRKNIIPKNIILVITVILLMLLIIFIVGRSYGFFTYVKKGEVVNVITINGISVNITNDDNALNLEEAEPLYDEDGMKLKAFTFTMTNTSSRPLDYSIKVLNDTEKQNACLINEGEPNEATCPVLTTDNIRYSYKLNNGSWNEAANLGANNDVITTYTINGNETLTYSIRMWIKSDATNDIMNHYFFGQLLIQGTQAAQEMYRPYDVATILSNFNQEDLKEVVACSNDNKYQDCEIYNTIEEAIAAKSKSLIIVTNDITKTSTITIVQGKDVTLDLNGKKFETVNPNDLEETNGSLNTTYNALLVNGNLTINDSGTTGQVITPRSSMVIEINATGNVVINGGFYNGRQALVNRGNLEVNGGTFGAKGDGASVSADDNITNINDGTFTSPVFNNGNSGILNIKGGTYTPANANKNAVVNAKASIINITGGTFISNATNAIINSSTGTINITQTDKPIYISSLAESLKPAISNTNLGIINITANQANACTSNSADTTSGLCAYAEGNRFYTSDSANAAVNNGYNGENTSSQSIININGGTYYGGRQAVSNHYSGTINIKNAKLSSGNRAVINFRNGVINVCDSTIVSTTTDLYNAGTSAGGAINYNNVTFSNGTTTPDSGKISGTVTAFETCPISE